MSIVKLDVNAPKYQADEGKMSPFLTACLKAQRETSQDGWRFTSLIDFSIDQARKSALAPP